MPPIAKKDFPKSPPKKFRLSVITKIILVILIVLLFIPGIFLYQETQIFSQNARTPLSTIIQTLRIGWQNKLTTKNGSNTLVFLILGTNRLPTRQFLTEITDTMMLVSINTKTGRVGLFSLPRDLWSWPYQTKIDALYVYGHDRYPKDPEQFPTEIVKQLTGIPIDRTIVLSPEVFANIIDTFGGVQIDVTRPFTDNQFPNPNVDVRVVHDPKQLYMTVEFKKGIQLMDGSRALEYIRSRHSPNEEGTDIARSHRQREVITSLFEQLQNTLFYTNVSKLGNLYYLYYQNFARYLPVDQAISLGKVLYPIRKKLHFIESSPSIYPDNPQGSIYHPTFSPLGNAQWVYLIRDEIKFQKEAKQALFE